MADMKTPSGRLTQDGVREVRRLRALNETYQTIAARMNVSIGTIYNIVKKKTWGWLQ